MTSAQAMQPIEQYGNLRCRGCARTIDAARGNWTDRHMSLESSALCQRLGGLLARFPDRLVVDITLGRTNLDGLAQTPADLQAIGAQRVNIRPFDDMGVPDDCLSPAQPAAGSETRPQPLSALPRLGMVFHNAEPSTANCWHPWNEPALCVDGGLTTRCRIRDFAPPAMPGRPNDGPDQPARPLPQVFTPH